MDTHPPERFVQEYRVAGLTKSPGATAWSKPRPDARAPLIHVKAIPPGLTSNGLLSFGDGTMFRISQYMQELTTPRPPGPKEPAGAGGDLEPHPALQSDLQALLFDFHRQGLPR
jgi:hypothetical protein